MSGDPYFEKVSLLLHMDGADNGVSFTDVTGKAVTRYGTVTKTGIKKFGTASAYSNGVNQLLTVANDDSLNFGTGDFTIECWVYASKSSQVENFPRILTKGNFGTTGAWNLVYIKSTGELYLDLYAPATTGFLIGTLTDNTWTHIAATRASGNVSTYLGGVAGTTGSGTVNLSNTTGFAIAAEFSANSDFVGYVDDVRLTKGMARYSTTFTPPAEAFPDYADPTVAILQARQINPISVPINRIHYQRL